MYTRIYYFIQVLSVSNQNIDAYSSVLKWFANTNAMHLKEIFGYFLHTFKNVVW